MKAEHLETKLAEIWGELIAARSRASRSKPKQTEGAPRRGGLLGDLFHSSRRGRKKDDTTRKTAFLANVMQDHLAAEGRRKVTAREALAECYRRDGKRKSRAHEKGAKKILNAMSGLRTGKLKPPKI